MSAACFGCRLRAAGCHQAWFQLPLASCGRDLSGRHLGFNLLFEKTIQSANLGTSSQATQSISLSVASPPLIGLASLMGSFLGHGPDLIVLLIVLKRHTAAPNQRHVPRL